MTLHKMNVILPSLLDDFFHKTTSLNWGSFMVAGGAVRDMFFDKPIKDIDVFYWGELPTTIKLAFEAEACDNEQYPIDIFKCTHKGKFNGVDVDFIKVKSTTIITEDVLQKFPCSISQICIWPQYPNVVRFTNLFKKTYDTHNLYFHEDCSEVYYTNIQVKYPDMPQYFLNDIDWGTGGEHQVNPVTTDQIGTGSAGWTAIDVESIIISYDSMMQAIAKPAKKAIGKKYRVLNTTKKDCYKEYTG